MKSYSFKDKLFDLGYMTKKKNGCPSSTFSQNCNSVILKAKTALLVVTLISDLLKIESIVRSNFRIAR